MISTTRPKSANIWTVTDIDTETVILETEDRAEAVELAQAGFRRLDVRRVKTEETNALD